MRYLSTSWVIERYQIVKKHPLGDVFVCPLKGLLWIIQVAQKLEKEREAKFPSPTGVNYYELMEQNQYAMELLFPSPTGVNYYE